MVQKALSTNLANFKEVINIRKVHMSSLSLPLSLSKLIFNMNINYAPLNFDSIEVTKYHSHNFDFAIDIEETSKCENTRSMIH